MSLNARACVSRPRCYFRFMTAKLKSIAETVEQLPAKDRAFLAERLLASLEETDLEKQWAEEAIRRRDEVRSGTVKPIAADEVYRRIERLLEK
jgi:putative addiction module component (TIGR02574 family)